MAKKARRKSPPPQAATTVGRKFSLEGYQAQMAEQVSPPVELINYELTSAAIAAESSRADAVLPSVSARIAELQRMGLIGQFY